MTFYDHHQTHKLKSVPNGHSHKSLILAFIVIIPNSDTDCIFLDADYHRPMDESIQCKQINRVILWCFFFFINSWPLFYIPVAVIRMSRLVFIAKMNCRNEDRSKMKPMTQFTFRFNELCENIELLFHSITKPTKPTIVHSTNIQLPQRRWDEKFKRLLFLSIWNLEFYSNAVAGVLCFCVTKLMSVWQIPNHSQGIGRTSYRIESNFWEKSDRTTNNVWVAFIKS